MNKPAVYNQFKIYTLYSKDGIYATNNADDTNKAQVLKWLNSEISGFAS